MKPNDRESSLIDNQNATSEYIELRHQHTPHNARQISGVNHQINYTFENVEVQEQVSPVSDYNESIDFDNLTYNERSHVSTDHSIESVRLDNLIDNDQQPNLNSNNSQLDLAFRSNSIQSSDAINPSDLDSQIIGTKKSDLSKINTASGTGSPGSAKQNSSDKSDL